MATFPLVFPSLSRQPSMDSSKSTEDDTIRDPMESGDVATRPRGTRARDTWKVNVRNITAEDKRALDYFQRVTAARGSNSFLFPNLLPNGSFEFPAPSAAMLAFGWYQGQCARGGSSCLSRHRRRGRWPAGASLWHRSGPGAHRQSIRRRRGRQQRDDALYARRDLSLSCARQAHQRFASQRIDAVGFSGHVHL